MTKFEEVWNVGRVLSQWMEAIRIIRGNKLRWLRQPFLLDVKNGNQPISWRNANKMSIGW